MLEENVEHHSQISVPIVVASDSNYAMPLATTLRSLADNNRRHWPLTIFVLNDGFPKVLKHRIINSLPKGSAKIHWRYIDPSRHKSSFLMPYLSAMTFARLQICDIMTGLADRVLYLDTDILVLGDLGELFQLNLGGLPLGATRDYHIDSSLKAGNLGRTAGIPRVRDYFNAGVLLFDIGRCEAESVFQAAGHYLDQHPSSPYSDQDALNAAFDGRWYELGAKWNFQNHHAIRIDQLDADELPCVAHFITASKPWKPSSTSVNASLYNKYRNRTQFSMTAAESAWFSTLGFAYRVRNRISHLIRVCRRPC